MALAAHILRLRVVVHRVFRNFSRRLQQMQLRSPMCLMAAHTRHFTARERIATSAYGMTLVGMSHGVVCRERDRRHVPRGHRLGSTQVATQAKIIRLRSQKVSIRGRADYDSAGKSAGSAKKDPTPRGAGFRQLEVVLVSN